MKNQQISTMILSQVAAGKSVAEAVDAILGKGTFSQIASDVYDQFTKKEVAP